MSLRNKIDLLRGKACVENFDIIAVTETWMDTDSKNFTSEFKIDGYEPGLALKKPTQKNQPQKNKKKN